MMIALKDISEHTGYSISTVSRALSNSSLISNETKHIIRTAAMDLNYKHSINKRRLNSIGLIGVIIPDISNYFFSGIVQGINDFFRGSDFAVTLFETGGLEFEETQAIKKAIQMQMSGLIVFSSYKDLQHLKKIDEENMPVVVIGSEDKGINVIDTNNRKGAFLVAKHLAGLGHTRIGMVSGRLESKSRLARLEGYKEALEASGVALDPKLIWEGSPTKDFGYSCAMEFLESDDPPTAVATQNDLVALGVIAAAGKLGVKIPRQLAVAGYDNTILATTITPRLTSVMQPQAEMGHIAAETVEQLISGKKTDKTKVVIAPKLIVRESTVGVDIYNNE